MNGAPDASPRRAYLHWFALLAVTAIVLAAGAGVGVFDRDEARFALAVREMRAAGEWFVPTNWGTPRYHKPILAYWLAIASENLLGPGERALRLPSLLAGLVAVAATVALARRRAGEALALRAGLVLATTLLFVLEAKLLTADALLLATTTVAVLAWTARRESSGSTFGWNVLFWIAVALGLLAKGVNVLFLLAIACTASALERPRGDRPRRLALALVVLGALAAALPAVAALGPVLCGAAALLLIGLDRAGWRAAWRASGAIWGLPLCLAIVATWLGPAWAATDGAFLREAVGHHLVARTAQAFEGHAGPPGFYLVTSLAFLFPWAALLPRALRRAWSQPSERFLVAWVVGPWLLLECSASKLPHYVLVSLPAVAILVARELAARADAGRSRLTRDERALIALPALLFLVGGARLAAVETQGATLAFAGIAALGAAFLAALVIGPARWPSPLGRLATLALALYLWLGAVALPALESSRLPRRLGDELARLAKPGEPVHLYRWFPASVGVSLPAGHPVLLEPDDELSGERGLVVVETRRLETFLARHPGSWTRVGDLRGRKGLDAEEVVVLRRQTER
jgi:4-amino-4-deoxy-L-arabinose transferase-like glycosyltransferase